MNISNQEMTPFPFIFDKSCLIEGIWNVLYNATITAAWLRSKLRCAIFWYKSTVSLDKKEQAIIFIS